MITEPVMSKYCKVLKVMMLWYLFDCCKGPVVAGATTAPVPGRKTGDGTGVPLLGSWDPYFGRCGPLPTVELVTEGVNASMTRKVKGVAILVGEC